MTSTTNILPTTTEARTGSLRGILLFLLRKFKIIIYQIVNISKAFWGFGVLGFWGFGFRV